jgi:hypothetical protein
MTQYKNKTSKADQGGLPGLSMFTDMLGVYSSMWDRHVQVLNEVWTDCTRPEATASDWPKAWNKLLRTWTGSGQDLCDSFMSPWAVCASGGAPLVTFVIDRSAETDAHPDPVPVPAGVDPTKLVATQLVSLTHDSLPPLASGVIQLLPVKGGIEIRVAVPTLRPEPGCYLSVVCEPKAGAPAGHPLTNSPDPPPRPVVATVLVVFI